MATETGCLTTLKLDSATSVLAEQRRRGRPLPDFPQHFPAVAIDPDEQQPVAAVAHYQVGKTPLLWFTPDSSALVVNQAVFSDLTTVDLPALPAGERRTVGNVTELALGMVEGRPLLEFLLTAQILLGYWHIGAELCIEREEVIGTRGYRARVRGEHTYFTNRENRRSYAFTFELGEEGAISVEGR